MAKLIEGSGPVLAAKNIRIELKAKFPRTTFTVHTSRYSMGNSIRVGWTDGPKKKQVEEIINKYSAGSFDGMNDLYTYNDKRNDFGSAKYIFANRSYSDSLILQTIGRLVAKYGERDCPSVEDYRNGRSLNTTPIDNTHGDYHWSWSNLIWREAEEAEETQSRATDEAKLLRCAELERENELLRGSK